jgi:hypothetical protein
MDPAEDVNPLFDELTAHNVLREGGEVAELLRARGLVDPRGEEKERRHYTIFRGGRGAHSVLFLLRAATPADAILHFLGDEDAPLRLEDDESLTLTRGKTSIRYEHPLAYVEAVYKTEGEWQIREVRDEEAWESACEEVFCCENAGDVEGYVERCLPVFRRTHPRSRALAFVWYLRAGPLVTFYRKKGTHQISVLQRYLLDAARGHEIVPWTGGYEELMDQLWLRWWEPRS